MDARARRRLATTQALCRALAKRSGRWWHRSYSGTSRRFTVAGTRFRASFAVHVVDPAGRKDEYQASITIWPDRESKVSGWKTGGWTAALVRRRWYEACTRELRRLGYRGDWLASEHGRFGSFWRRLDADGMVPELERLERIKGSPWARWGTAPEATRSKARRR